VTDLPPELPPVPKVPLPGETLEQYRLRVVESKVDVADAKLDIITNVQAGMRATLDSIVSSAATKSEQASRLRVTIIGGLTVGALGAVITVIFNVVQAALHLAAATGGGTPAP
jgi:hypothetical protein